MKIMRAMTLGLLATVVAMGSAQAASRYVPTQYATVQAAEDASAPGDFIYVYPGVYTENVTVDVDNLTIIGGSCFTRPPWPIYWTADVDSVIDGGGAGSDTLTIDSNNVHLKCLTIRHGDTGIYADPGVGLWVDQVYVVNSDDDGIYIDDGDNFKIRHTKVVGAGDIGIEVEEADNALIEDTTVHHTDSECFYLDDVYDSVFQRNTANNCEDDDGMYIYGDRNLVKDNVVKFTDDAGIEVDGDENTVSYNTLRHAAYSDDSLIVDGDDNVVEGNDIAHCYYDCLYVTGDRNLIQGNVIDNAFDDYCACVDGDDVNFLDNSCTSSEQGFYLSTCDNCRIEGNSTTDIGDDVSMEIDGDSPAVVGNRAVGGGDDLFDIDCNANCRDGEIRDNYAEGSADDADGFYIDVDDSAGMVITGNTAINASDHGFDIDCDNCDITHNTAKDNGNEVEGGFYIDGDDNYVAYNTAKENHGPGIRITGCSDRNKLYWNTSKFNTNEGILVESACSDDNVLERNIVAQNLAEGIDNEGTDTDVKYNQSQDNRTDCTNDGTLDVNIANLCKDGSNFLVGSEIDF